MTLTVEVAFGWGPYDAVVSWTDVSQWLTASGVGVFASCRSGRDGRTITPGTGSFTLDNSDDRFNPLNFSSPYSGQFAVGTPVRFSDEGTVVWSGYVAGGWPYSHTTGLATVTITCHDVFGLISQATAPETALAGWVAGAGPFAPDHWWTPGPGGWVDRVTGAVGRHTGGLTEMDPVVNGDEHTWGQTDPDGVGVVVAPEGVMQPGAGSAGTWLIMSAWIRLSPDTPGPPRTVDLVSVLNAAGEQIMAGSVRDSSITMWLRRGGFAYGISAGAEFMGDDRGEWADLFDGSVHHVFIALSWSPWTGVVYIDGLPARAFLGAPLGTISSHTPASQTFGGGNPTYSGVIDHLMLWGAVIGDESDMGALAGELFTAGRQGFAGHRLDQRATELVTMLADSTVLGTIPESGVITHQSYRQGDPIGLLQAVEDTEQGRFSVRADGKIDYFTRRWEWTRSRSKDSQAGFSDQPTSIAAGAIEMIDGSTDIAFDPLDITNVAQVTSTYGRMQTARQTTSIAAYGERGSVHLSGLLHGNDAESKALAEWIVERDAFPLAKVRELAFAVETSRADTLPFAVEAREGDRVYTEWTLQTGATGGGPAHVNWVQRDWSTAGLTVTLGLVEASTRAWFRWGTSKWDNSDSEGWSF